jgi:Domain of unknown function (DUF4350)
VAGTKTRPRRTGIVVAAVIGAVIALNLAASGIDRAVGGSEPKGVAGSSYGTQPDGLGGLETLLTKYGYPVSRNRGSIIDASLDINSTVFVIEPRTLTDTDETALLQFASAGGRLVIGGSEPFYLHRFRDRPPVWSPDGATRYDDVAAPLGNVTLIDAAGTGSWKSSGSGTVLVRAGDTALLTEDRVGRGTISFLADASPIENAYLARADNAAFALGLAGDAPRPVEFIEGVHGYGEQRGLGAIPTQWKISLLVLAAAAVVLAWSRSRRFGPPDRPARDFPPARSEYVRALAVSLERTRDPAHALAPMQQWARARVAQRAHLRPDASLEEIDRAAMTLGFSEGERAAIWHPATDDDAALALGHVVSRLSQQDGRTT